MEMENENEYHGFLVEPLVNRSYGVAVSVTRDKHIGFLVELKLPPTFEPADFPSWIFSGEPPLILNVRRTQFGGIVLVGCSFVNRASLQHDNTVRLYARFVVDEHDDLSKIGDLSKIRGIKMQYEGLTDFFYSSFKNYVDPHGIRHSGTVRPSIVFDEYYPQNGPYLQTLTYKSSMWDTHFKVHRSVRELLTITFGRNLSQIGMECVTTQNATDDFSRWKRLNMSGSDHLLRFPEPLLFSLSDLPDDWLDRWIDLRKRFSRGIFAFISLLERQHALSTETKCIQLGTVIEFIATQLVEESEGRIKAPKYWQKTKLIYDGIPKVKGLTVRWHKSMPNTYNKTKHIDEMVIGTDRMLRDTEVGTEVVRMWIATQMGVDASVIQSYYESRPLTRNWGATPRF